MPVGKNALKRVTNNGYSKVTASAPDMENSVVVATEVAKEEAKEISVKASPKKNTAPKEKKPPVKKPEAKKVEKKDNRPDGFVRYGLGSDLPEYLL